MKKVIIFLFLLLPIFINSLEVFKGYSPKDKKSVYSVASLLESKYEKNSRWNENYFHDAIFPDKGITIFTNILFYNGVFNNNASKFNCVITFDKEEKYVFDKEYNIDDYQIHEKGFRIDFDKNHIELKDNIYILHVEDEKINLDLEYKIINPPNIFGDGIITIDNKSHLAFSEPISGAIISGNLKYDGEIIALKGRGSVSHDYNVLSVLKNPTKWRSFWLYNDEYSVNIHTVILTDGTQVDRVVIFKDNKLVKNFLNTGLVEKNYIEDKETEFSYPSYYTIDHTDNEGDSIKARIYTKGITDKIQVFEGLSPALHSLVVLVVGEMWAYRFWSDANIEINVNGNSKNIKISGIGNFVDTDK